MLTLYAPTLNKKEFVPRCVPSLPESFLPSTMACQTVVMQIASVFGAASSFMISEGIVLSENDLHDENDTMSSS